MLGMKMRRGAYAGRLRGPLGSPWGGLGEDYHGNILANYRICFGSDFRKLLVNAIREDAYDKCRIVTSAIFL
ncbi:MAG: hypothetical protein JWP03_1545 [Phycisphaerales bacterium]|nr:hypothetical protein [Phycisphaerales bacterium]